MIFSRWRLAVQSSWHPFRHQHHHRQHKISFLWLQLLLLLATTVSVTSAFLPRFPVTRHRLTFFPYPPPPTPSSSTATSTFTTAIMGIKGFRAWFESQFPNAITTLPDKSKVSESFDHVLMDMNQFLHICLRKSRSDGHALTLLLKELDAACTMARPLKSLVLAMDGPPSAAKLATQRQRRFATLVRCQARFQHIRTFSSRFSLREQTQRKRRYNTETKTICVTPGTDFMRLAEQAILYWAWQRLSNPRHFLAGVQIYISTSLVPGEGEVKLLDWIVQYQSKALHLQRSWQNLRSPSSSVSLLASEARDFSTPKTSSSSKHHNHHHHRTKPSRTAASTTTTKPACPLLEESYAILGGDSDLVLEGLVIQATNVFVLLHDGKHRFLSVSLWETTRTLHSLLEKSNNSGRNTAPPPAEPPSISKSNSTPRSNLTNLSTTTTGASTATSLLHPWQDTLIRVRTDLVLLLILNGNDYLPRIRGSSGFNKLFHSYFRLLRQWKTDAAELSLSSNNQQRSGNQTATSSRRRRGGGKQKKKQQQQSQGDAAPLNGEPFLVNPTTLEFNLPFCIAFFRQLVQLAPPAHLLAKTQEERAAEVAKGRQRTALSQLHNLVDSGFIPSPIQWKVIRPGDDSSDNHVEASKLEEEMNNIIGDDREETYERPESGSPSKQTVNNDKVSEQDSEEDDDDDEGGQILVRLILGEEGAEDCCTYEAWHTLAVPLKDTKHELARIALEDQLGSEFSNLMDENEDDDNFGITSSGYAWEISHAMPGKVDKYLAGLLWNLQTYQDGVCSDYAFNYGKRLAPTANEIVDFLEVAVQENRKISRKELIGDKFEPSINAGLASLAALPSQVKDLVPLPYRNLSTEVIEEIYGACMDPEDNAFDIRKFERLANESVEKLLDGAGQSELQAKESGNQLDAAGLNGAVLLTQTRGEAEMCDQQFHDLTDLDERDKLPLAEVVNGAASSTQTDGSVQLPNRKIRTGDNYWTVVARSKAALSSPFEPPAPFSDRLAMLWPSNRIRVSRSMATWAPRQVCDQVPDAANANIEQPEAKERRDKFESAIRWSQKLKEFESILDVPYKKAYVREGKDRKRNAPREDIEETTTPKAEKATVVLEMKKKKNRRKDVDVVKRMQDFKVEPPTKDPRTTVDGFTPLACLKQLEDSGVIGETKWTTTAPSTSKYASFNPKDHEWIELSISPASDLSKSIVHQTIIYGQDRDANSVSRQMLKQHLASLALREFTGPERQWFEFTFKDLKNYFSVIKQEVNNGV